MASTETELIQSWSERATMFRLVALAVDGTRVPVDSWDGGHPEIEVREQIEARSMDYTNGAGGVQRFALEVLDAKGVVCASSIFRITAELLPGGGEMLSEPANAAGLTAQAMRHVEVLMQTHCRGNESLQRTMQGVITRLDKRLQNADGAYVKMLDVFHEVTDAAAERDMERDRAERKLAFQLESGKKLLELAPTALNAIVMKKAPEGADLTAAHAARLLFDGLKEDQIGAILSVLGQEKGIALLQLFQQMQKQETAEAGDSDSDTEGKPDGRH